MSRKTKKAVQERQDAKDPAVIIRKPKRKKVPAYQDPE